MALMFASANRQVTAEYARLESAVINSLSDKPDVIEDEAYRYARRRLHALAPSVELPPDASEISELIVDSLIERFRAGVDFGAHEPGESGDILPAGDVAFTFSCIALYAVGKTKNTLSDPQRRLLLDACAVAEKRPLPVMRWTDFVRSNLSDVARVRTVMRACVFSKTLLDTRISNAFSELSKKHPLLPKEARILAIGSSGTVCFALEGLMRNRSQSTTIYVTRLAPGHPSPYSQLPANIDYVDDASSRALLQMQKVNLVVLGCAVIGKTKKNEIEVVNWDRDVALAKEAHKQKIPVVVIGALHKIWPEPFYESHKSGILDLQKDSLFGRDGVLTKDNMDWLVTENEAVNFENFADRPQWINFWLGAQSLDVTATLAICTNKRNLIKHVQENEDLEKIDRMLGRLSGVEILPLQRGSSFERSRDSGRQIPPGGHDDNGDEPTLESVVAALESAKSGELAALRRMYERNYEMANSLIAEAYSKFPRKFSIRQDVKPNGALSMISREILGKLEHSDDAKRSLAFWLSATPNYYIGSRYLLNTAWTAAYVLGSLMAGLDDERGHRAAITVVDRLYRRPRERDYMRRLEAT